MSDLLSSKYEDAVLHSSPLKIGDIAVKFLWADSLGAKSYSLFVETPDITLLVDPGAASMQPGYPLDEKMKKSLKETALKVIKRFARKARLVAITHYHFDHFTSPEEAPSLYRGKKLLIKDPNRWINASQWKRAREFLSALRRIAGPKVKEKSPSKSAGYLRDPVEGLNSSKLDFGDYNARRQELFSKGRKWLEGLFSLWENNTPQSEFSAGKLEVSCADGRTFSFGGTKISFSPPLFHGIEYDRTGWVIALIIERGGYRVLYTSDLQGPQIEDYADWIIEEKPDLLIADGPPTYLLGFMMNRINFERSIRNMCRILRELEGKRVIYDHHLYRDKRYRERMEPLRRCLGKPLPPSVAEFLGLKPLIDTLRVNSTG